MKLKFFAEIKTNFPEADFWLIRKGAAKKLGEVTREFYKEHIGVKVTRTDILLPDYLYYVMMYVHQQGVWKVLAKGTLKLVHITTKDVKELDLFKE